MSKTLCGTCRHWVRVTPAMLEAGRGALLEQLGDDYDGALSWRTAGLSSACGQVFREMLRAMERPGSQGDGSGYGPEWSLDQSRPEAIEARAQVLQWYTESWNSQHRTQMSRQPPIDIIPIQIREDLTVQIAGVPHDLTREEAEKIARVVLAMAAPDPDG